MVSVIIPIYNVEKYLKKCIDSVLEQTYTDLQIILVDDGSPDNCGKICDEYKAKDSRVEVIHKENGGLGLARNSGMEIVRGEYLLFVDSDDWIDKNHIEIIVDAAEKGNYDVVLFGYKKCSNDGAVLNKSKFIKLGSYDNVIGDILFPIIAPADSEPKDDVLPIGSCFKLHKVQIIKDNNLKFINEKECISEDMFFNIDYLSNCKNALILETYGYNYRVNPNSISNAYSPKRTDRTFIFYKKLSERLKGDLRFEPYIEHRVQRCYLGKCRTALRMIEASSLTKKEKIHEVSRFLNNECTVSALKEFPIENYRSFLRIISRLMKSRASRAVLFAFKMRRKFNLH